MQGKGAMLQRLAVIAALASLGGATPATGQTPFFPGAEGFGGSFLGAAPAGGWFSDASVYHVTNLNDSGPGSFRNAFEENSANKIIVFDVAGTITLTSDNIDIKNLANYYIAGQTAPGPVTVYGDTVQVTHSSDKDNQNVILRYMTFRKGTGSGEDALTFAGGSSAQPDGIGTNMIFDHVSVSWAEDENLSVANNNTNVTVQHSIIADATGGSHSYGSLVRPRSDASVTLHHNLYANNKSRQPRLGTYNDTLLTVDVRNNVVYNWSDRATYAGGSSEDEQEHVDVNYVGNYFIAGPWTDSNATKAFIVDKNVEVEAYQAGNFIDSDRALNPGGTPNGSDTGWGMFQVNTTSPQGVLTQLDAPISMAPVTTQSAPAAYEAVTAHAGNSAWGRDAIDGRIVDNVLTNTAPANGPEPDAPLASELSLVTGAGMTQHPSGWDSDGDAMPDHWEVAHGLDPQSSSDWSLDFDDDGYINLIEYVNERGEFPAGAPIRFTGEASARYAEIHNWRTDDGGSHWQPSRFDDAHIDDGAVVVDSVGQHAGRLVISAPMGSEASLTINDGWLQVAEEVVIGSSPEGSGSLVLNGGVLETPALNKGAGGSFTFTGGALAAASVGFDLTVDGGALSPGTSVGQLHVNGDLALAGELVIEIASSTEFDSVSVAGVATLGGALNVVPLDDFDPANGAWEILTADGFSGAFNSITEGYAAVEQGGSLWLVASPPGDFNTDGLVDARDYAVWRDGLASGQYTAADYELWRGNFGVSALAPTAASAPEPGGAALIAALVGMAALRRW